MPVAADDDDDDVDDVGFDDASNFDGSPASPKEDRNPVLTDRLIIFGGRGDGGDDDVDDKAPPPVDVMTS